MEGDNIDEQLAAALSETARLRSENERLRKLLRIRTSCPQVVLASEMDAKAPIVSSFSSDEKVRLFRGFFKGREDVYAVRWEGRSGKAGYSPACANRGLFASKVEARANREFLPLTDLVVRDHLSGKLTVGVMHWPSWRPVLSGRYQHTWNGRGPALARMYGFFSTGRSLLPSLGSWVLHC